MSRRIVILVAILALAAVVVLLIVSRQAREPVDGGAMTGQSLSQSAPAEQAYITYNFPAIPLGQFLDEYEALAGKKVAMQATQNASQTVHVITPRPLTKSEALRLCEEVLKEQAGLIIVHGKDGSLTAVATANTK
jgi:type II secretory pathway component GspD/PulD (secretin)